MERYDQWKKLSPKRAETEALKRERAAMQAVVDAARELLEVADLRGDSDLPHPADDENTWTARMQTAWDDTREALAALDKEAKDGD